MKNKSLIYLNIVFALLIVVSDILYMVISTPAYLYKTLASALFLILGIVNFFLMYKKFHSRKIKLYALFIMIALVFCFLGDVLLIDFFIIGAVFFAIGHIFYIIAFSFLTKLNIFDLICYLLLFAVCLCIILLIPIFDFNDMLAVVIVYAGVISLMLAKSFINFLHNHIYSNTILFMIFFGALLFFFSDLMLMLNMFTSISSAFGYACLSLYYPAEFILAFSIVFINYTQISPVKKLSPLKIFYCRSYQFIFKLLLPILPYREPKLLLDYKALCQMLKEKNINKAILVTSEDIVNLHLPDQLLRECKENDIELAIFDKVLPDPTIKLVEKAREFYIENNCQAIIAFGGGSVMDCAKALGARIVKPKKSLLKMKGLLKVMKKLPTFVALPTTAGTGSETTLACVITDSDNNYKFTINDFSLIPHYAILDYKTTLGLPKGLTASTGMDALTHAIEAYIGRSRTKYTKHNSEEAVKLIVENLYLCYQDGQNEKARENMLRASFMAGNAFTRSYVGYVHAIAHSLGGQYHVPHGLANAKILPVMLKEYRKTIDKKLGKLALISHIASENDSYSTAKQKMIDFIEDLNQKMNIEEGFSEIQEEDINSMASRAEKEANPLYPVPKLYSKEELARIYLKLKK